MHTYICVHTHARTHAHTHSNTHTHIYIYIYLYTYHYYYWVYSFFIYRKKYLSQGQIIENTTQQYSKLLIQANGVSFQGFI